MCGIFGIINNTSFKLKEIINGLEELEYRGYDSSGVTYLTKNGALKTVKSVGKITKLKSKLDDMAEIYAGISHTRWATHGSITITNAHPHTHKNVSIVHNGIINNYETLKKGICNLKSNCDSEVIAHLLYKYLEHNTNIEAMRKATSELNGSYAILALINNGKEIICAKNGSPLYVVQNLKKKCFSSDLTPLAKYSDEFYELEDGEYCIANDLSLVFYDKNGKIIAKKPKKINFKFVSADKGKYPYFMEKEINDIPTSLNDTLNYHINHNCHFYSLIKQAEEVHFIGCGTAYHSGLFGTFIMEEKTNLPSFAHIASELIGKKFLVKKRALYVLISQSGETSDTLNAMKILKQKKVKTICITNTLHSTLATSCDYVFPIFSGKEIAVASTKVYNSTILAIQLLALNINSIKKDGKFPSSDEKNKLRINYDKINEIINEKYEKSIAKYILKFKKVFFIGKGKDYVTSLEASLKLKEISYINCSAMQSGELKHGTLALVDKKTVVIACITNKKNIPSIMSALNEVKSRSAKIIVVQSEDFINKDLCNMCLTLPHFTKDKTDQISIIPFQKIAYYTSLNRKLNPDKPRNLAKSVTVA